MAERSALLPLLAFALLIGGCDQMNLRPAGKANLLEIEQMRTEANKAYSEENWDAAEKSYRKLVETVPSEADNWFRLGNIYAHRQRYTEAIQLYREALVREPAHSRAWHNLGITQLRMATATFLEMQNYTEANDPAGIRARHIVDAITQMLEESTGGATPEEAPAEAAEQ